MKALWIICLLCGVQYASPFYVPGVAPIVDIKAVQFLQQLLSERSGKAGSEVLDAPISSGHFFMKKDSYQPSIHRISDASGRMKFTTVSEGSVSKSKLDTNDVFVVDTVKEVFVWFGENASEGERRNALEYAHQYLMSTPYPFLSVILVKEGNESAAFNAAF
ncbi:gelsolin-like protein 2 [Amphiura filiformis]|uniref:gelsolin-like protein 2 n=1 Tax=Amphiura filiformis TaxID=82378 RepID=UPI003B212D00